MARKRGRFRMVVRHDSEAVGPLSGQEVGLGHPEGIFDLLFLLEIPLQV